MTKNDYMIELIRARRSTRNFKATPVEKDKIEILKETVLRAPSSRNLAPWQFVFTTRADVLQELSRAKPHGAAFLNDAPLAVVMCADIRISDVWIEDCAVAAILLQMTAQSMGLGSCWVQIRRRSHDADVSSEEFVRKLFSLPEHYAIASIIAIGYPDEIHNPILREELLDEKIHCIEG